MKSFTHRLSFVLIILIISAAVGLLHLLVWEHGVSTDGDAGSYLERGYNLYKGYGLTRAKYDPIADNIIRDTERGRLILWSTIYGFLLWLGTPFLHAPSIISLLSWLFFLLGLTWLTYRLTSSLLKATFATAIASVTSAYWVTFQSAWSEVLFLPLLVWLMAILVDLPDRTDSVRRQLTLASFLLALLMLTRFPGILAYGAVLIWWSWSRLSQNQLRQTLDELATLLVAAIPFGLTVLSNLLSVEPNQVFGHQLATPDPKQTFIKGMAAVGREGLQLIIPAVNHPSTREIVNRVNTTFFYLLPIYLLVLSMGLYSFWYTRPNLQDLLKPPRSPLLIFLALYLVLYTIGQPFLRMSPMDIRDSTTLLAILQPWAIYWLMMKSNITAQIKKQATVLSSLKYYSHRFLSLPLHKPNLFLASLFIFSLGLIIIPIFSQGIPNWITLYPPRLHDLTGRWEEVEMNIEAGVPRWLMVTQPRTYTAARYHADLLQKIESLESDFIIAVHRTYFTLSPQGYSLGAYGAYTPDTPCRSKHDIILVLLIWDRWRLENESYQTQIEQKCPNLQKINVDHGIIYFLDKTNP